MSQDNQRQFEDEYQTIVNTIDVFDIKPANLILKHRTLIDQFIDISTLMFSSQKKVWAVCAICKQVRLVRFGKLNTGIGSTCSSMCKSKLMQLKNQVPSNDITELDLEFELKNPITDNKESLLLPIHTRKLFNLDISQLKPNSNKNIMIRCRECHILKKVVFQNFSKNSGLYCQKCLKKQKNHFLTNQKLNQIDIIKTYQLDEVFNPKDLILKTKTQNELGLNIEKLFQSTSSRQKVYRSCANCGKVDLAVYFNIVRGIQLRCKECSTKIRLNKHIQGLRQTNIQKPKEFWLQQKYGEHGTHILSEQTLPEFWSTNSKFRIDMICGHCQQKWSPIWDTIARGVVSCGCQRGYSINEENLFNYIKTLAPSAEHTGKTRTKIQGYSVDIWIPDQKIAIEYNGLWWHSFNIRGTRDYRKYKGLQESNIRYIGIFEDEWLEKPDIIKTYFKNLLRAQQDQIKLRPQKVEVCYTQGLSQNGVKLLKEHHYIGNTHTIQDCWEIKYNNETIGLVGIGLPSRQNISENYEIKRICLNSSYKIPGVWSYIFKNYIQKYYKKGISITTFSDNRRDLGSLYEKLGFKCIKKNRPDFYWCKGQKREHKSKFKMNDKIRTTGKSEIQYWEDLNYYRVFDCGKTKWRIEI